MRLTGCLTGAGLCALSQCCHTVNHLLCASPFARFFYGHKIWGAQTDRAGDVACDSNCGIAALDFYAVAAWVFWHLCWLLCRGFVSTVASMVGGRASWSPSWVASRLSVCNMASLDASPWRNKLLNELCTLIISSTREKNLRALPKGRRCSKERIISTPLPLSLSVSLLLVLAPHCWRQHSCCCCCCTNCMQFRVMFKWLLSCQADPSGRVPRVLMMLHWRLVAYVAAHSAASRQHLIMKKAASSVIWHTLRIRGV